MQKGLLTWVFWTKIPLGVWRAMWPMSEWVMHVHKSYGVTVWVVSKNESNCLVEYEVVICTNLETCQISVCSSVKHFMAYYVAILPLLMQHRMYNKFPVSFLLYIATKKKLRQIITVNSSTNAPITKKITPARFACLCYCTAIRQTFHTVFHKILAVFKSKENSI